METYQKLYGEFRKAKNKVKFILMSVSLKI